MIIDERYKKEYVPEDPTGNKKLSIQLWFDVIDIVEINEPEVSKQKSQDVDSFQLKSNL